MNEFDLYFLELLSFNKTKDFLYISSVSPISHVKPEIPSSISSGSPPACLKQLQELKMPLPPKLINQNFPFQRLIKIGQHYIRHFLHHWNFTYKNYVTCKEHRDLVKDSILALSGPSPIIISFDGTLALILQNTLMTS